MPIIDLSSYHQPPGTVGDGTKFDNMIDAVQAGMNGLDTNNLIAGAGIKGTQLASGLNGPPGSVLAYVEVTSNQTSTATTAATATSIISAGAVTFDGTAVFLEFFCPLATHSAATTAFSFDLYDGATDLGILGQAGSLAAGGTGAPVRLSRVFSPSAASHTFSVRLWGSAGTMTAVGGAGGAGTFMPFYIRITKV